MQTIRKLFYFLFILLQISCSTKETEQVKRIGFLKQIYTECYLNSATPKVIRSFEDIECVKSYPKEFQDEIRFAVSNKNLVFNYNADEEFFVFWDSPSGELRLTKLGEIQTVQIKSVQTQTSKNPLDP